MNNIYIPEQLQRKEYRFCKLKAESKLPIEGISWKNSLSFDDEELLNHIQNGGNYAVVTGPGNLRILDADKRETADYLYTKLDTFAVKTCGDMMHYYVISDYDVNSVLPNGQGEMRCHNLYAVGPNCFAIDNKKGHIGNYEVAKDLDIKHVPKEYLEELMQELGVKNNIRTKEYDYTNSGTEFKEVLELVKKNYNDKRIDAHMRSRGFIKWIAATPAYKEITIRKARDAIAETRLINSDDLGVFTNFLDMAEKFIALHPIYYEISKIWWIWNNNDKCWQQTDEIELMILIDEHLRSTNTLHSATKGMIMEALKRVSRKNKPQSLPSNWIQFKNGLYDINTGEIIEASPEYFTVNPIPWNIGENEDTPNMDRIFKEWVGEDYVQTLYEIIAYGMITDYPIHRIFCLVGTGSNGKSKFLELNSRFIGVKNVTSTELDVLLTSRFEITKLHKKLVCQMGETDFSTITRTSVLKKLSGQDLIGFEYKGKDPFEEKNYAKILIATNNLPLTEDKTTGFYRRWLIIDFPNEFTEKKDILSEIPNTEYENLAKKSVGILTKILEKREFTNEGTLEQRKERYELKSNYVTTFIDKYCVKDVNAEVPFQEFYGEFVKYCKRNKIRELSAKKVGSMLGNLAYSRENRTITKADTTSFDIYKNERISTSRKVIIGLRFKKSTDDTDTTDVFTQNCIRSSSEKTCKIDNIDSF